MTASIIVALDVETETQALSLLDQCDPQYAAVKIGSALFTRLGPSIVRSVMGRGFRVFLDLKFHDIPTTVAASVKAAAELGVWMLTLHASGGGAMLAAAHEAVSAYGAHKPLLIAVTVFTSQHENDLKILGIQQSLAEQVLFLAHAAQAAQLAGVVCSGWEVAALKARFGPQFLAVTPGIRLQTEAYHDQQRVLTPLAAQQQGSDYLVIGRPITLAAQPGAVLRAIYQALRQDE